MIALDVGDKIRGDASAATVIDYTLHGIVGSAITQIADGQLAATETDIYTAASIAAIASIILVNTGSSSRTINLYLTPSAGTSRRLIPKDMILGAGHSLHYDGSKISVLNTSGAIIFSFANPMTDAADMIVGGTGGVLSRLAKGAAFQALLMNSGATAQEWAASLSSLLTAAGDLPYASAANTPARLAITANKRLFGNAGGTAPEWATGIKLITFTRNCAAVTETVAYTGVGFKPSLGIFLSNVSSTVAVCIGMDDGTNHYNVRGEQVFGAGVWASDTGSSLYFLHSANVVTYGHVESFDADGFTFHWFNGGGSGTATILAQLFR